MKCMSLFALLALNGGFLLNDIILHSGHSFAGILCCYNICTALLIVDGWKTDTHRVLFGHV
jgi:hypothetical protein